MVRRKSMRLDNAAKEQINDDDRITRLPNDVIHHIYSYLDSRFCVQSSLLSRSWRDTWKSHPHLNLKIDPYAGHKFPNFVHRFLSDRNKNAEISTIDFQSKSIPIRLLKEIVSYAMSHMCQKVNISYLGLVPTRRGGFDSSIFKSHFLQDLCLRIDGELLKTPNLTWDLPALTTLHLARVSFKLNHPSASNESFELFSTFPNLKTLVLVGCRLQDIHTFYITSSVLKNLTLNHLQHSCQLVISTPKLTSFTYLHMDPSLLLANDLNSLETVHFQYPNDTSMGRQPKFVELMINTFQQLYKTKFLILDANMLGFLSRFPELLKSGSCPFVNLQTLTLNDMPPSDSAFADIISYLRSGLPGWHTVYIEYKPTPRSWLRVGNRQVIMRFS